MSVHCPSKPYKQRPRISAPLPAGKRQTCLNEGEPVTTRFDAQIIDCFPCTCRNGYVECDYKCPRIDDCHFVVEDRCCKICKGCIYKGVTYASHTEWIDPQSPCRILKCEAGVVTISDLHCYTPCPNPLPPEPGKCCRTCPVCQINGQVVGEDRVVVSEEDPCLKCRCSKGRLTCSKKACPVLQCSGSNQYKLPGECCPRCNGTRAFFQAANSCSIQRKFFRDGESYKLDKCTNCQCINSTSICTRSACPVLDCALDLQRTLPNNCCPTCIKPQVEEVITQCSYRNQTYEDGNVWQLDACSSCKCHDGKMSCARISCNNKCEPGTKEIHLPRECCPRCIEVEGTCMAFGDPHYKTFDGKMYTFKGEGKYQLIEDCKNGTFSIKVANDRAYKYMNSAITKRVAVNFGHTRLNLQQRLRVKYNGQKITLPFKKEGQFRVNQVRGTIEVRLQNDVVIVWNGRSFLEVTVPATYKGKLCGLCGNFNGEIQDDLQTKAGKIVSDNSKDLMTFGASWCVGKKQECAKQTKPNKSFIHYDTNGCRYLNNEIFAACEPKLSNTKYYRACKMDMSNCMKGQCYCESLMAYARECERLGVSLPNWQKHSNCDFHGNQRHSPAHHRKKSHHKQISSLAPSSGKLLDFPSIYKYKQSAPRSSRIPIPLHDN